MTSLRCFIGPSGDIGRTEESDVHRCINTPFNLVRLEFCSWHEFKNAVKSDAVSFV